MQLKSAAMMDKPAIFAENSFAERLDIEEVWGPTFDIRIFGSPLRAIY